MHPHRTGLARIEARLVLSRLQAISRLCLHASAVQHPLCGGMSFEVAVPATIRLPAQFNAVRRMIRLILLVTALIALVHQPALAEPVVKPAVTDQAATRAQSIAAVAYERRTDLSKLPRPVAEMIDAINLAVNSGEIEDLRTAIEWNELPPTFAADPVDDPIAYLKQASTDKAGRQMLALMGNLLSVGPAHQHLGRDPENSGVFIWPYLAERPLDQLTPAEEVDLYRLVPADIIAAMRAAKRWTWYRLVIGADGTWHAFMR
ncbi:MAG TPA: hypothetical protein P5114_06945 [Hyphomicrobiaceae bacterium]|nr:hypothetical protein [Hyphomicrobiaceae bacterium]